MATLAQQQTTAADAAFQGRVSQAMRVAAVAISNEAPGTGGHALRAAFARQVLTTGIPSFTYALAVATDPTIADQAATDAQIQNAVNSQWNAWCGNV